MPTITQLTAMEILDSRGRPTVKCTCALDSGAVASASVPSGASTGTAEAVELRDGDEKRYAGLGCLRAAGNVGGEIAKTLSRKRLGDQAELDGVLIELDGTANKSRLGANATLAVSLAFARAHAVERGVPLYQHFADMVGEAVRGLPRLTVNLFSGGKHAGGQVEIQDVLVVPVAARSVNEALAMVFAVYRAAAELCRKKYDARPLVADEGGLAPPFPSVEAMLGDAAASIEAAGFTPGRDVALAVDVASSHFFEADRYRIGGRSLGTDGMVALVEQWVTDYPIVSVEDGLAEGAMSDWPRLRAALRGRALTLGDDLLCTNPGRIRAAIASGAADALLLKVNQIGTLTEAAEAQRLARAAGWRIVVSARSGETEDDWLADLATAWGDDIKVGSITRSERLAKYNRLLEIEAGLP
jgi:enolase